MVKAIERSGISLRKVVDIWDSVLVRITLHNHWNMRSELQMRSRFQRTLILPWNSKRNDIWKRSIRLDRINYSIVVSHIRVNGFTNPIPCLYQAGPEFELSSNDNTTKVIGHYDQNDKIAMIQKQIGKGTILLSGVHPGK
eukprot:TRINITY_DN1753_c0_g1_i1.p1 TRINITY_DN1753_c0_g1~~TRINITY_DN1753_c0_g1_i1.p1  ORF type:complete len:140 (+),score=18.60 TRINITY_DN1753_c0_g1_i1:269-688(+)